MFKAYLFCLFTIISAENQGILPAQATDERHFEYQYFNKSTGITEEIYQVQHQDDMGYLWFSGRYGIYMYNGTEFEKMLFIEDIYDSVSGLEQTSNLIIIGETEKKEIWIKPSGIFNRQLIRYNPVTNANHVYYTKVFINEPVFIDDYQFWTTGWYSDANNQLLKLYNIKQDSIIRTIEIPKRDHNQSNIIYKILLDRNGQGLWMASSSGLIHFDTENDAFTICTPGENPEKWSFRDCDEITYDADGYIWLDFEFGPYLYRFDPIQRTFDAFHSKINNYTFKDITQIIDFGDSLWLVDGLDELLLFNKKSFDVTRILHRNDPQHYIGNITNIFVDPNRNTWVGGTKGVLRISIKQNNFRTIEVPNFNAHFKKQAHARNLELTSNGQFWLASQENLYRYDFDKNQFSEDLSNWDIACGWEDTTAGTLPKEEVNAILEIVEDKEENIWISGFRCLKSININSGIKKILKPFTIEKSQSAYPIFRSLTFDSLNFIWGGGMDLGIGRIDPETGEEFLISMHGKWGKEFGLGYIYKISFTHQGQLIFISRGKILTLKIIKDTNPYDVELDDYKLEQLISDEQFQSASGKADSIWKIPDFWLDVNGDIWMIGNDHVFQFNPTTNQLTYHQMLDDVVKMGANKAISDLKNRIWFFSKYSGIYCFDTSKDELYHFTKSDGVPSYSFLYGHNIKRDSKGRIFVWTLEGVFYYAPDQLINTIDNDFNIVYTHLQVNNKKIYAESNSPIHNDIRMKPEIYLDHSHKTFSLRYSVLDNSSSPGEYRYKYKLEGFDEDWIVANSRTYLSYSNIPPGEYQLKINASKDHTYKDKNEISILIHMSRAPWLTWWALTGYALILLVISMTIISLYISKERKQDKIIMEQNELRKTREIEQVKNNFFTNISHELRTPLTLIIEPLKDLVKGVNTGDEPKLYNLMLENANKLKIMIDQILDVSKIEAQKMTVNARYTEISSFTRQILSNFNSIATKRNINFDFHSPLGPLYAWIDHDKYEKILNNLVYNAFKFTQNGGSVDVKIDSIKSDVNERNYEFFRLTVEDSGAGISKDKVDNIFNRFYQVEDEYNQNLSGTGIGLSLVQEFVNLHHGQINVESQLGSGTKFIVTLPMGKEYLEDHEVDWEMDLKPDEEDLIKSYNLPSIQSVKLENAPLLLIADDQPDMVQYIKSRLQTKFRIIVAENGVIAQDLALKDLPDLIISDVIMPEMNGFELCKRIKEDHRTSHIPIILLTAKADPESRISGLEIGADDYIQKPFDLDILIARCQNLILQRQKLSRIFKEELLLNNRIVHLGNKDKNMIQNLIEYLENSIDDPDLTIDKICLKVGLSRSQFYRKILALTNQKPTEFIRTIRLKKAAELIINDFGTISEIAYSVGFGNLPYFTKSFKKEYGMTPKDYKKQNLKV
jgi:signal transduction histidine kinase/DNA-binding response OmpR family regulator/streptogramin lyase